MNFFQPSFKLAEIKLTLPGIAEADVLRGVRLPAGRPFLNRSKHPLRKINRQRSRDACRPPATGTHPESARAAAVNLEGSVRSRGQDGPILARARPQ